MSDFHLGQSLGELRALSTQILDEVRDTKREVHDTKRRVTRLEKRRPEVPSVETWLKRGLTVALPLSTFYFTGSLEKALQVAQMLVAR